MGKIRLLSIDGGGIRGILPGTILQILEEKIQVTTGNPAARIVDYFDFISGTSTGAIIGSGMLVPASGNSRLARYSVREIVDQYHLKGGGIFRRSFFDNLKSLWGVRKEKYNNSALQAALKDLFGDCLMSELLKPCLLPTYEIESRRAVFITQHKAMRSPADDFLVRDAVLATCSAPTFFEATKIPSRSGEEYALIDGGVFANNPAMCAYAEARKLTFGDIANPISTDMILLSLGTGSVNKGYPYDQAKNFGSLKWIRPLISILMSGNSETVSHQLEWLFDAGFNADNYIRIQPDLLHASVDMDDASISNLNALRDAGISFVAQNEELIDAIVQKLIGSREEDPV